MTNPDLPQIDFAAYRVATALADGTWTIRAEGAPDLNMALNDKGMAVFRIRAWKFRKPEGFIGRGTMETYDDPILIVHLPARAARRNPASDAIAMGSTILEAAQRMMRHETSCERGSIEEMEAMVRAIIRLTNESFNIHAARPPSKKKAIMVAPGKPSGSPLACMDVMAFFHPAASIHAWESRYSSEFDTCLEKKERLWQQIHPDGPPETAHQRLETLASIERFYDRAAGFLKLLPAEVDARIEELALWQERKRA